MRALVLWALLALPVAAQETAPVSGYDFLDPGTRAMQDDDFLNPGFFAVERGAALWQQAEGASGKSCADCHGNGADAMRGVAARYPLVDAQSGALMNLELRINDERARRMQAEPLALDSPDMIALTAFLSYQSRGVPMAVVIDGPAQPFFDRGRDYYLERRGQLDLACTHCHDGLVGQKLRGDTISQGQINGFPIYRILWREMGSRHRMFQWCNTSLRAEPHALGSPEYLALELYLAWRGKGLPIEAPAVRR